jgi:hypothetical protein
MSNEKDLPALGDMYAIRSPLSGIDGPYYVVSIRGSKVALGRTNKPDHTASRTWRAWSKGLHPTGSWSTEQALRWSDEVADEVARARAVRTIERNMPFTGVHTSVVVAFALAIKNAKVTT